jgi:hypothetical protein
MATSCEYGGIFLHYKTTDKASYRTEIGTQGLPPPIGIIVLIRKKLIPSQIEAIEISCSRGVGSIPSQPYNFGWKIAREAVVLEFTSRNPMVGIAGNAMPSMTGIQNVHIQGYTGPSSSIDPSRNMTNHCHPWIREKNVVCNAIGGLVDAIQDIELEKLGIAHFFHAKNSCHSL